MSDAGDAPDRPERRSTPGDAVAPVRERMREFLAEHEEATDRLAERSKRDGGRPLSDIVDEEREERL